MTAGSRCAWCGETVGRDDGFRAYEPAGERVAAFCRLEHLVPWAMRGAHWEPAAAGPDALAADGSLSECAWCSARLGEAHVLLVRARGEHRIPDGFCGVGHLLEWAKAGGRYR